MADFVELIKWGRRAFANLVKRSHSPWTLGDKYLVNHRGKRNQKATKVVTVQLATSGGKPAMQLKREETGRRVVSICGKLNSRGGERRTAKP